MLNKLNIYIFIFLNTFLFKGFAGEAKFTAATSKNKVAVGETFQIEYTINTNGNRFTPPNLSDFTILGGPNQSQSMQFINGSMSQSLSFSYFLTPKKEGTYTISGASINADGKTLTANSLKIEVVKGSPQTQQQQQNQSSQQQQQRNGRPQQSAPVDAESLGDNIFLKVSLDKSKVYVGEQITATFKIYTRVNIVGTQASEMPKFNGFWSEELKQSNAKQYNESMEGIQYTVAEIKKTFLYPQRSGKLEIEPLELQAVVRQRVKSNNIFDQLFGGGVQDVPVNLKSKRVTVDVMPLPEPKPENFSGMVGKFDVTTKINRTKLKANESINYKVTISGKGNLKLSEDLKPQFPPDFEAYDPKLSDNFSVKENGVSGSRTFDYLVIPRASGTFEIPAQTFAYFDIDSKKYKTISTEAYTVEVEKGAGDNQTQVFNSTTEKQDIKVIGNDIRYIKSKTNLKSTVPTYFGSTTHFASYAGAILMFISLIAFRKQRQKAGSDIVAVKRNKATKVAIKRLNNAKQFLDTNDSQQFYLEISRALNGYVGDKYNMSLSESTSENISKVLLENKVPETTVKEYLEIIKNCEFARFAPSTSVPMNEIYSKSINIIEKLEAR